MFRTADLSLVKLYVQQQFSRILQNRASPQDFIYAKEVKMGSYS
jgi:DNA polymerase zeta